MVENHLQWMAILAVQGLRWWTKYILWLAVQSSLRQMFQLPCLRSIHYNSNNLVAAMISCVFAIHRVRVILLLSAHFNILSCIHSNSSKAKSHLWSLRPTLQRITVMLGLAISSPRCTGKGNLLKFKKNNLESRNNSLFPFILFFQCSSTPGHDETDVSSFQPCR